MLPWRAQLRNPDESLSFAGPDIDAAVGRDFERQADFSDTPVTPASETSRGAQSRSRQSSRSALDHRSDKREPAVDIERKERGGSPPEAQPRGIAKARVDTRYDSADTVSIESQWSPWSPNHTWGLHAFFHRRGTSTASPTTQSRTHGFVRLSELDALTKGGVGGVGINNSLGAG